MISNLAWHDFDFEAEPNLNLTQLQPWPVLTPSETFTKADKGGQPFITVDSKVRIMREVFQFTKKI